MKQFKIAKEATVLQSETPHYQFDNHVKHGMKRKKFARHEILTLIHINKELERNLQMTSSNMKSN